MELREAIETRRSVRKFTDEMVSHETIEKIVDMAKNAPSWKNTQTARYIIVENPDLIAKIANDCVLGFEYNQKTLSRCTQICVLATVNKRCGYEKDGSFTTSKGAAWEMFDAGIAAQTFCLAAHDLGVGTCIMGIFDEDKMAEALELPEGMSVSAIIAMGIPAFAPNPVPRKEVEALLTYK